MPRTSPGESLQQQAIDVLLRTRIEIEQRALLFTQGHLAMLAGPAFALLLVALLRPYVSPYALAAWWLMRVVIVGLRVSLTTRWRESLDPDAPVWGRYFLILLTIDGLQWGLLGTWLIPNHVHDYATLVLTALLGVGGFAAFVLQTRVIAILLFNVPLLVPAAVLQMTRGDLPGLLAGIGIVLFVALLAYEGWRSEQRIHELLRLRFSTDRIAQERAQALALAQHHSHAKDQFLATMSHEMRTPLHGILGITRLMRSGGVRDGESDERLALIERSGEHLLRLINDLLDLSKIEARKTRLAREPLDLVALLNDIGELLGSAARDKALTLEVETDGLGMPSPRVLGDVARLRQVLLNLIGNAIKFTDEGGVRVVARQAGTMTVIEVHDTGIGIAPEELPHIFDAFHQADGSFARRFDGTGLGLTISRQLAQAMEGELSCRSVPGVGSVFVLNLPLPRAEPADLNQSQELPPAEASPAPAHPSGGRVLLAEDNDVNALVACAILERAGFEVQVVPDGEAAVAQCQESPPDLVLMDCQMPVMDGFVATQRIREHERQRRWSRMPIIALTANAYDADRERCLAVGMDDHLAKPYREEDLLALLGRWMPSPRRPVIATA